MQNDSQGVGRPASAAVSAPVKPDDAIRHDATEPPVVGLTTIASQVTEIGGPSGPEPTRFGDWEKNGRCIDF